MTKYTLSIVRNMKRQDGLTKPKSDINTILARSGFKNISQRIFIGKREKVFSARQAVESISDRLLKGDLLVVHYPTDMGGVFDISLVKRLQKKGVNLIAIIHDIDALRFEVPFYRSLNHDIKLLNRFSVVISPNETMISFLRSHGLRTKTVNLQIFDYLINVDVENRKMVFKKDVFFAGNLNKSQFVYQLKSTEHVNFNIFGPSNDETFKKSKVYRGSYDSDDLISKINGGFGLIWDGAEMERINTVIPSSGGYLQYNNPYKLSFSIATGVPVFIWSGSAEAQFVKRHKLGYTISSIGEIPDILNNVTLKDYKILAGNVKKIQQRLISGEYTRVAMEKAVRML